MPDETTTTETAAAPANPDAGGGIEIAGDGGDWAPGGIADLDPSSPFHPDHAEHYRAESQRQRAEFLDEVRTMLDQARQPADPEPAAETWTAEDQQAADEQISGALDDLAKTLGDFDRDAARALAEQLYEQLAAEKGESQEVAEEALRLAAEQTVAQTRGLGFANGWLDVELARFPDLHNVPANQMADVRRQLLDDAARRMPALLRAGGDQQAAARQAISDAVRDFAPPTGVGLPSSPTSSAIRYSQRLNELRRQERAAAKPEPEAPQPTAELMTPAQRSRKYGTRA